MASMRQKIGVIGVGAVGSASLLSTVLRGGAREIVVVNRDPSRARGVVADVQYGAALSPAVDIRAGDCEMRWQASRRTRTHDELTAGPAQHGAASGTHSRGAGICDPIAGYNRKEKGRHGRE